VLGSVATVVMSATITVIIQAHKAGFSESHGGSAS
jgi:hypothetical protein